MLQGGGGINCAVEARKYDTITVKGYLKAREN